MVVKQISSFSTLHGWGGIYETTVLTTVPLCLPKTSEKSRITMLNKSVFSERSGSVVMARCSNPSRRGFETSV